MFPARFIAAEWFAISTGWTKHKAFVLRPSVVSKQCAIFFQSYAE